MNEKSESRIAQSFFLQIQIKNLVGISLDLLQLFGTAVEFQKVISKFWRLMVALNIHKKNPMQRAEAVQIAYSLRF